MAVNDSIIGDSSSDEYLVAQAFYQTGIPVQDRRVR